MVGAHHSHAIVAATIVLSNILVVTITDQAMVMIALCGAARGPHAQPAARAREAGGGSPVRPAVGCCAGGAGVWAGQAVQASDAAGAFPRVGLQRCAGQSGGGMGCDRLRTVLRCGGAGTTLTMAVMALAAMTVTTAATMANTCRERVSGWAAE